ncbi:MAG: type I-D CRISPR-associated endonuclease Cas1d [Candidatus Bipolaricaulaceae bacterium]
MSTVYLTQDGAVVRKAGERLKVSVRKQSLLDLPLIKVDQLVLFGNITVTQAALQALLQRGADLVFLTSHGRYLGRLEPEFSKNGILRRAQYAAAMDPKSCLELAKGFVRGKLLNMRAVLQRASRGQEQLALDAPIAQLRAVAKRLASATSVEEVRGLEGNGTAMYFQSFDKLIKAPGFGFPRRVRRPPTDPVNALLSFGYVMLHKDACAACNVVGFDPYIGYLHADRHGKPSLALDLMEEFRPVLIDSLVLRVINKRMITADDFEIGLGNVHRMKPGALKTFLRAYEEKKRAEVRHPSLDYRTTYWRCVELQARVLAKAVSGELERYVPFLIR